MDVESSVTLGVERGQLNVDFLELKVSPVTDSRSQDFQGSD